MLSPPRKMTGKKIVPAPHYSAGTMPTPAEPYTLPTPDIGTKERTDTDHAPTFNVICWNDPVSLMEYVTHVFMKIFGWEKTKARKHMLEVRELGKSVLVREGAEKAEFYVHELQKYKLHATMERAE